HIDLPMIHRHPTSTLFPYTTLFRSRQQKAKSTESCSGTDRTLSKPNLHCWEHLVFCRKSSTCRLRPRPRWSRTTPSDCGVRPELDRKSTRLNSSHVAISYAVFCLKK